MPTEQITTNINVLSTSKTCDNDIYDMATQQLSDTKSITETVKDHDIYMLATQPINIESLSKYQSPIHSRKRPPLY